MVEIVPPNPDYVAMMQELLAQNRMILQTNIELMKVLSLPPMYVRPEEKGDKE